MFSLVADIVAPSASATSLTFSVRLCSSCRIAERPPLASALMTRFRLGASEFDFERVSDPGVGVRWIHCCSQAVVMSWWSNQVAIGSSSAGCSVEPQRRDEDAAKSGMVPGNRCTRPGGPTRRRRLQVRRIGNGLAGCR